MFLIHERKEGTVYKVGINYLFNESRSKICLALVLPIWVYYGKRAEMYSENLVTKWWMLYIRFSWRMRDMKYFQPFEKTHFFRVGVYWK